MDERQPEAREPDEATQRPTIEVDDLDLQDKEAENVAGGAAAGVDASGWGGASGGDRPS